jgi:hypothetical protein
MRQALRLHPDSRGFAVANIEVGIARPLTDTLALSYIVTGDISEVRMPLVITAPARAENLWRHTCFEAFFRPSSGAGYYEFNFAPSTQWAAYQFSGYRSGQRVAHVGAPSIETRSSPGQYTLRASLNFGGLADLPSDSPWRVALSAVIEDISGNKSYWALAHSPGRPDFHHANAFAQELALPVQP